MFLYYLQLAWRRCCKAPAMTSMIIVTLAVGIAAFTTSMTIVAAFMGEPLPRLSPHLYVVTMDAREVPQKRPFAYSQPNSLLRLRDAEALVAAHRASLQASIAENHADVRVSDSTPATATWDLEAYGPVLREFGVHLLRGRTWTHREQVSRAPVAMIDTYLSTRLFGTTDAVGRTIEIDNRPFRIIGVSQRWQPRIRFIDLVRQSGALPRAFHLFLPLGSALNADLWPFGTSECDNGTAGIFGAKAVNDCGTLETWVWLPAAAAVAAYQRFIANYAGVQHSAGRFVDPPRARLYQMGAWVRLNHVEPPEVALDALLSGAFLLLCMVTVASLLTARFLGRQADTAVRRAIGATRAQILAQHLVESGVLGVAGGLAAAPLAWFGAWVVRQQPANYAAAAHFNGEDFAALIVLAVIVSLLVGVLPGWRACRQPPAMRIRQM